VATDCFEIPTRSKAVEQALGCVAQKMGFCDCIVVYPKVMLNKGSIFQDSVMIPRDGESGSGIFQTERENASTRVGVRRCFKKINARASRVQLDVSKSTIIVEQALQRGYSSIW
jgi:hypothetical protein